MRQYWTFVFLIVMGAGLVFTTGCTAARVGVPVTPSVGMLYADIKAPLTVDFHGNATGGGLKSSQTATQYFWIPFNAGLDFAWGEADIHGIAESGGIKEISYADYEFFNLLGIYQRFTVNVYGK